jgi:hypothetical protein
MLEAKFIPAVKPLSASELHWSDRAPPVTDFHMAVVRTFTSVPE